MRNQLLRAGDLVEIYDASVVWTVDDDGTVWNVGTSDSTLAVIINPDREFAEIFVASVCEIAYCDHKFLRAIA